MRSSHADKDEAMEVSPGSPAKRARADEGPQAEMVVEAQTEKLETATQKLETETKNMSLQDKKEPLKKPEKQDARMDGGVIETISMRLAFIEKRTMHMNILPHEVVRQVITALKDFNYTTGESDWITRTLSDLRLALHMRYLQIKVTPDYCRLVGEVVFTESLRRILMDVWRKGEATRNSDLKWYYHIIHAMRATEVELEVSKGEGLINDEMLRLVNLPKEEFEKYEGPA